MATSRLHELSEHGVSVWIDSLSRESIRGGPLQSLIDGDAVETGFARAAGNLRGVNVLPAMGANVYDILNHDTLVLTKSAVEKLEARFNG